MLAATVMLGEHGRRRAGLGDEFWQYRPAHQGDSARMIDWRRSARSDAHFVREREWQAAQSVTLWVDPAKSMTFTGDKARAPKADRAKLLALAIAVLLLKGGERVGLAGMASPRSGRAQMLRLAARLSGEEAQEEYGAPETEGMVSHGRAVFLSDFLGDLSGVEAALGRASDRGVRGALIQILDPAEEEFPFDGRTIFESMGGTMRHETQKAGELRTRYLARLAERNRRFCGPMPPCRGGARCSWSAPSVLRSPGFWRRWWRCRSCGSCCARCRPRRSGVGFRVSHCSWA